MATSQAVHLHCAQCDAQLGIFENEWVHLTPSYARPKERGINMGCRLGSRTQVVPQGPTQKEAAGCMMVELFCDKCSSIVGQSCKTAPNPEQQTLLNQRFFKLSRIYLTDVKDERREDPVFVDDDNFDNPSRSTSVRSGVAPKQRALSRSGFTPSFRQSYPPPSSQTPFYDQYQGPQDMPPPRQVIQQIPPSPVLVHYPPPPATYPYSHHAARQQSDIPEPYQPSLANLVPELQQDLKAQAASISECLNRITTAERRLASDETRVSNAERRSNDVMEKMQKSEAETIDLRQQIEQFGKDSKSQNAGLVKTQNVQAAQERLIKAQAEQIASLTEKLTTFQTAVDELEAQMRNLRSQSLIQQNPRPNSYDFLENMEIMVGAMRSAQSREQEVESLRERNSAMKARLGTIVAAMGSVSEEDAALLEESSLQHDQRGSPVLGKRKRASDIIHVEQRKLARRISSEDVRDQSLPTPESTQGGKQSSNASQTASTGSQDPLTLQERISLLSEESRSQADKSLSRVTQKREKVPVLEAPRAVGVLDGHEKAVDGRNASGEPAAGTGQVLSEQRSLNSNVRQALTVNQNALQAPTRDEDQSAHLQRGSSASRDYSAEPVIGSNQIQPLSVPRYQHPAIAYGRMSSAGSMQNAGANASYFSTTTASSLHSYTPTHGNSDAQPGSRNRDEPNEEGTFSHALSRGHRLEDIIRRPSRPSSANTSYNTMQKQGQAAPEITEGSAESTAPTAHPGQTCSSPVANTLQQNHPHFSQGHAVDKIRNSQVVEFSDEENIAPTGLKSVKSQDKQSSSTTPTGDPRTQHFDRAEVARTIRELTQEPLRRPVIITPSPGSRGNMYKGTAQLQQRPILPGFATAIHNLDDSAARHRASSSSRVGESEASLQGRWRWKEPVVASSPNTSAEGKSAEQTDGRRREKASVAPESQASVESIPAVVGSTRSVCETPLPLSKPRGRPRKSSTTARTGPPVNNSNLDNDDNCAICTRRGKLLCCDGCPKSYHHRCLNMDAKQAVEGDWYCPECTNQRDQLKASDTIVVKPQHDSPVMMMRRKLAEEAMARDMARKV